MIKNGEAIRKADGLGKRGYQLISGKEERNERSTKCGNEWDDNLEKQPDWERKGNTLLLQKLNEGLRDGEGNRGGESETRYDEQGKRRGGDGESQYSMVYLGSSDGERN